MFFDVDILIPTYKRKKFEKLISHNISIQTYPLINSIIIADDSNDNLNLDVKYSVLNYKVERMSIGKKRNFLLSQSKSRYAVFMDTDDFYHPDYVTHSIYTLLRSGKSITGSSDMLMYYKPFTYKLRCVYLHGLNEATLVIDTAQVKFRFTEQNSSEALEPLKEYIGDIAESDIDKVMMCLCHEENTINKKIWLQDKYKTQFNMADYIQHLNIFNTI